MDEVDILLVEDTPADAELTIRALRKQNLASRLHHVMDGAEALDFVFATGAYGDRIGARPPHLVLLDLKLPRVDGLEVLARMKAEERTRAIPVVVLTSSNEERDVVESYRLGVNSYVLKPIDWGRFAESVGSLGLYWMLLNQRPR